MEQVNVLIIGVIYNTFPETIRYIKSLAPLASGNIALILVDNSDREKPSDFAEILKEYPFILYVKTGKNLGYFQGAQAGLKYYMDQHSNCPQWVLVTNVDIVFTTHFFERLTALTVQKELGVVAPSIISQKWKTDYNPQLLVRYPKWRLRFYRFIYASFIFHNLFLVIAYLKKWMGGLRREHSGMKENPPHAGQKIYAPHGSCLVFTNNYFINGGLLDPPDFLFGEEIVIAETAARLGLDIEYHPELVIHDYEHASTGFFVTPKMNRYNRLAIRSILDRYYR